MNQWQQKLSKNQITNIYKNQKRQIGKYFALWSESGHLNKFMVTLSPTKNAMLNTVELRKEFFKKLGYIKYKKNFQVAYFSAIEIGINKNPPTFYTYMTELNRIKIMDHNYHLHIQLFTNMTEEDLQGILNKINPNLCIYSMLSTPKKENIKYDYVIKDIKSIDWQLQYILKNQHKSKIIYTSSRKEFANYIITKLWYFMKTTYSRKWITIKDKYQFILNLKKCGNLIINKNSNNQNININLFDLIQIKNIDIYIKKNIL